VVTASEKEDGPLKSLVTYATRLVKC
jgi:hypothetical protein